MESETDITLSSDEEAVTLEELLAQVSAENLHEEISGGEPIGKEIW